MFSSAGNAIDVDVPHSENKNTHIHFHVYGGKSVKVASFNSSGKTSDIGYLFVCMAFNWG